MNNKEIIKACGGVAAVASALGLSENAVFKWYQLKTIPKPQKYWGILKNMAKLRNVELNNNDFL